MILRLMLLLQLLLVTVGQFLRRRLKRIVRRMVAVQISLGRNQIQMAIFFHGPRYFFFYKSDVNIITAVVNINVVVVSIIFYIICLV
jgi:hypothetical protein